jgi:HK97 family phage portal protein
MYFGQGTHPGVIVSHPGKLGTDGHTNLKNSLTQVYSGLGNSHRLMLLEEGMTLTNVGIPPNDSQFLESRTFQITEVARWFNLPVHKLKEMSKSSFNNIESEQISFVVDSILPWCVRLEQNYQMQLLTQYDRNWSGNGRYYWKHSVDGLMRGDAVSRSNLYKAMFGIGAMSPNDVRKLEDLDPIEGGDKYFVPLNMVPLDMVEDLLEKQMETKTAKSAEKPEPEDEDTDEQENGTVKVPD